MDTRELLQWAAQLGVGGLLAAFIFLAYQRLSNRQIDEAKGRESILVDIVTNNTIAITQNTSAITEMRHEFTDVVKELKDEVRLSRERRTRDRG